MRARNCSYKTAGLYVCKPTYSFSRDHPCVNVTDGIKTLYITEKPAAAAINVAAGRQAMASRHAGCQTHVQGDWPSTRFTWLWPGLCAKINFKYINKHSHVGKHAPAHGNTILYT